MLGLGLGIGVAQTAPLKRYSIGGKAPAVVADYSAGVYGLNGTPVAFDGLFSFARLSAAWKRNALGHWVKVLAGEPRTGHHIWQGGQLVPAGVAICSEVRTNLVRYSEALDVSEHWSLSNNAAVESAGELSGIPAFKLTDANTSGYGQINQSDVTHEAGEHVFQMLFAKDQNPTSQFSIRLVYSVDEVNIASGMSLAVDTGTVVNHWDSNILERNVEDRGDHWLVWFAVDLTGASNILIQLFPAHNNTSGEGGPENVGSHICTAVHLHPGRYPQDYIKTEGAAVSVAAESSQIDPVSVAKAVGVFGPELWDDTATTLTGEAEDLGGGRYRIVSTTGSNSFVSVPNALSTLLGVLVLAEYTVESSTGEGVLAQNDGEMRTAPGRYSEIIIPDLNNATIKRAGITDTVISNISYRQVTMPEALTFLIKGTMTYADEDSSTQVLFSRWLADSNNFIEIRLHTGLPSSTGDPFFLQSSLGAVSSKITNTSPYAPGTEVPFSLGFVLSATEIEGFYNGISTGTAAYGGMANLLSAPLQLFQTGNATIKDFRIWPEALPSADMLEATG